jgi:hypothetical protein
MSDKQNIMKFESLPNEIFICCFEYLNAPDIFYAFEQLNPRFYRLIRTIPLRLNFENIHKSIFDRFCEKMLDYTEIQKQIYSLKLSNENTHGQIYAFFTYFSLDEFTQLRSLSLIEIKENNLEQLSSILPLLSQLTCLRLIRRYVLKTPKEKKSIKKGRKKNVEQKRIERKKDRMISYPTVAQRRCRCCCLGEGGVCEGK